MFNTSSTMNITFKNHYAVFTFKGEKASDSNAQIGLAVKILKKHGYTAYGKTKLIEVNNMLELKVLLGKQDCLVMKLNGDDKKILDELAWGCVKPRHSYNRKYNDYFDELLNLKTP